jgi:hypothetical protein
LKIDKVSAAAGGADVSALGAAAGFSVAGAGAASSVDGAGTGASTKGAGVSAVGTGAGSGNARTAGKARIATATTLAITRIGLLFMGAISREHCDRVFGNLAKGVISRTILQIMGNSNLVG